MNLHQNDFFLLSEFEFFRLIFFFILRLNTSILNKATMVYVESLAVYKSKEIKRVRIRYLFPLKYKLFEHDSISSWFNYVVNLTYFPVIWWSWAFICMMYAVPVSPLPPSIVPRWLICGVVNDGQHCGTHTCRPVLWYIAQLKPIVMYRCTATIPKWMHFTIGFPALYIHTFGVYFAFAAIIPTLKIFVLIQLLGTILKFIMFY